MYHVVGTLFTISLLYLISFLFYRIGIYSLVVHRKLWNTILALTFLFTALAGIFMALQINYKWDIPFIKTILKWHVETGVALGVTGIFHFIWHLSYFGKIFSRTEKPSEPASFQRIDSFSITANLFIIGFTSTSIQVLLIREIMNISGGYELITGVFLGSWLIASAAGAALAGRSNLNDIRKINLIFSVSPFVSMLLLILLSRLFLESGETPSFLVSMILTLLFLVPFCLVSGFTFIKLISSAREINGYIPGKSFSIETIGSIVAGILLAVLTAGLLNTYKLLLTIIILTFAYTILTFYIKSSRIKIIAKTLFFILLSFVIISDPDVVFRQLLLPGIKVTETKDTPYGNITIGEYSGEKSTYYNQRLLAYNDDAIEREENIHYALLQEQNPEKILLISGSLQSLMPEVLKYHVKKVYYVERDPALVKSAVQQTYDEKVQLVIENKDAYRYIRGKGELVDVAILLLPPPSTLSLNRFYTADFFNNIKNRLVAGGVFMCSPGSNDNYLNPESVNLYSSIFNSLKSKFKNVVPVVGNRVYFIASDDELSVSFCRLTKERGIKNIYVSSDFMDDDLIEKKSSEVKSLINPEIRVNRAAFPIACFHFQSYNFSKSLNEKIPAIALMLLAFAAPVITIRRRNLIMYFSASALAGFEIIMLLALQLTIGNMYQFTGIVLAALMAGLSAGTGINIKFLNPLPLKIKALILIVYYTCAALCFNFILGLEGIFGTIFLIIISIILPSLLTGNIFRDLTISGENRSTPSLTYSADLAGSALGFILISGIAIPYLGIRNSIFLLAILILTGILFGTNRNK